VITVTSTWIFMTHCSNRYMNILITTLGVRNVCEGVKRQAVCLHSLL